MLKFRDVCLDTKLRVIAAMRADVLGLVFGDKSSIKKIYNVSNLREIYAKHLSQLDKSSRLEAWNKIPVGIDKHDSIGFKLWDTGDVIDIYNRTSGEPVAAYLITDIQDDVSVYRPWENVTRPGNTLYREKCDLSTIDDIMLIFNALAGLIKNNIIAIDFNGTDYIIRNDWQVNIDGGMYHRFIYSVMNNNFGNNITDEQKLETLLLMQSSDYEHKREHNLALLNWMGVSDLALATREGLRLAPFERQVGTEYVSYETFLCFFPELWKGPFHDTLLNAKFKAMWGEVR